MTTARPRSNHQHDYYAHDLTCGCRVTYRTGSGYVASLCEEHKKNRLPDDFPLVRSYAE